MADICFYFELHQPYRLAETNVFDIGLGREYFQKATDEQNRKIFQKVARKSYVPMLKLLLKLVRRHPEFHFSFSASGIFLEQAQEYAPVVIDLLKKLVASDQVEVLAETYYHSLAALYSKEEFEIQVTAHEKLVEKLFDVTPKVFRNTELIYSNQIGQYVEDMGYDACLTEAVDRYLHGRERTQVFVGKTKEKLPLLLKHAQLSDDIAFRFSEKAWVSYPLTAPTYLEWVDSYRDDQLINLFMDFETFGEHQWEDTGIFEFYEDFVGKFIKKKVGSFLTPSQVVAQIDDVEKLSEYDVPEPISWADVDRDLTAWVDNALQQDTIEKLYKIEKEILKRKNKQLLEDWRRLQTSDHFYYMCTKWAADGDVHAYFSPYDSPFEAYRRYTIVLADLQERLL